LNESEAWGSDSAMKKKRKEKNKSTEKKEAPKQSWKTQTVSTEWCEWNRKQKEGWRNEGGNGQDDEEEMTIDEVEELELVISSI